jgi:hypothetical protein
VTNDTTTAGGGTAGDPPDPNGAFSLFSLVDLVEVTNKETGWKTISPRQGKLANLLHPFKLLKEERV